MSTANEVLPATRIITLLEANDARASTTPSTPGQWTNNLAENTVIREGDAISVKQSMIDTTSETEGLIEIDSTNEDIEIQFGMYLQDSGNGTLDGGTAQSTGAGNFMTYSGDVTETPSGKNYILQDYSSLPLPNVGIPRALNHHRHGMPGSPILETQQTIFLFSFNQPPRHLTGGNTQLKLPVGQHTFHPRRHSLIHQIARHHLFLSRRIFKR